MANRKISGRVSNKSDTSANWATASANGFIPLKGEVIFYSDVKQVKIGDGTTLVGNLPFIKARSMSSKSSGSIIASGWVNNTYSFETYYPSTSVNIQIELAPTATAALVKAYSNAIITGNATTNVITALGTVPTIDIPIIITVEEK